MNLITTELTKETLGLTRDAWEKLSPDLDEFLAGYQNIFIVAENNIDYEKTSPNKTVFYGICDQNDSENVVALVEIIKTKPTPQSDSTKLLALSIRPDLVDNKLFILNIYKKSIEKVFDLSSNSKHNTFKFYGRNAELLVFLTHLYDDLVALQEKGELAQDLDIKMQGRWLSLYI